LVAVDGDYYWGGHPFIQQKLVASSVSIICEFQLWKMLQLEV